MYFYSSFHLVFPSLWPFLVSFGLGSLVSSVVFYWHFFGLSFFVYVSFLIIISFALFWYFSVFSESYEGSHTFLVASGLRFGIVFFMISEIFLFFSFFWTFFHKFLSLDFSSVMMSGSSLGSLVPDPFSLPFLKTTLLLSSGVSITCWHHSLTCNNTDWSYLGYLVTIVYAVLFLIVQFEEFTLLGFSMKSSVYGSIFFLLTGFHGAHVLMGTLMILNSWAVFFVSRVVLQTPSYFFTSVLFSSFISFDLAAWYWHFVDLVWLFLFLFVYSSFSFI